MNFMNIGEKYGIRVAKKMIEQFDADPSHLDNDVFDQRRRSVDESILNLHKIITIEECGCGVQICTIAKESSVIYMLHRWPCARVF